MKCAIDSKALSNFAPIQSTSKTLAVSGFVRFASKIGSIACLFERLNRSFFRGARHFRIRFEMPRTQIEIHAPKQHYRSAPPLNEVEHLTSTDLSGESEVRR